MKQLFNILSSLAAAVFLLPSCDLFVRDKDSIGGKAGEVIVVADRSVWDSEAGQVLSDSLMREFPCLPQREPLYSLVHVPHDAFTNMFKVHRNIIFLTVDKNAGEATFTVENDKWATHQVVFSAAGRDSEAISDVLKANMQRIISTLDLVERNRVISNTRQYCEKGLSDTLRAFTGGAMVFPSGYTLKKKNRNFIWISYETHYMQQGFLIYKRPAADGEDALSAGNLIQAMNETLEEQVPGSLEGSFMTVSSYLEPTSRCFEHDGRKITELRGLWEVKNDFMGGPFVSHNFLSRDGSQVITLEAYVYAPKYDKRLYLRQVESLLYSFSWE